MAEGEPAMTGDFDMQAFTTTTIEAPAGQVKTGSSGGGRVGYFDLETIPDFERQAMFGLEPVPDMPPITSPENLMAVDEFLSQSLGEIGKWLENNNPPERWLADVIAAEAGGKKPRKGLMEAVDSLRSRLEKIGAAAGERQKLLSVTPEFCRIVAIGWAVDNSEPQEIHGDDEVAMLNAFWGVVAACKQVCGYNITGFDLNVIYARSIILDVKPTRKFDSRPWGADVIDLMKVRFSGGGFGGKSLKLKTLAACYGISVPAEDTDGSQVLNLYLNDQAKLAMYVKSDVWITRELHRKFKGTFCE